MSLEHVPTLLQSEQFKVYEFPSLRPGSRINHPAVHLLPCPVLHDHCHVYGCNILLCCLSSPFLSPCLMNVMRHTSLAEQSW